MSTRLTVVIVARLALPLICACFVGGCPKSGTQDCTGFSQVDAITVEVLEPYVQGGSFAYGVEKIPVSGQDITGPCPPGMLDSIAASSTFGAQVIGLDFFDGMACIDYKGRFDFAPQLVNNPDHQHATALLGGTLQSDFQQRGELVLNENCHGQWWVTLVPPSGATTIVPAPPLGELLFARAIPGQEPPLLLVRVFSFGASDGCFEVLDIDVNEFPSDACFDVWAAQAHPVQ